MNRKVANVSRCRTINVPNLQDVSTSGSGTNDEDNHDAKLKASKRLSTNR